MRCTGSGRVYLVNLVKVLQTADPSEKKVGALSMCTSRHATRAAPMLTTSADVSTRAQ